MKQNHCFDFEPVTIGPVTFRNPFYVASGPTTRNLRQLQKAEGVCHGRPAAGDPLGDFFLGEAELFDHELVGLGLLDGAQVVPLDVLDQGEFEHVLVGDVLHQRGDLVKSRQ